MDMIGRSVDRIASEQDVVVYWEWLSVKSKENPLAGPLLRLSLDPKLRNSVDVPVSSDEVDDFPTDHRVRSTVEGRLGQAVKSLRRPDKKLGF
jgi:hypothetical protein